MLQFYNSLKKPLRIIDVMKSNLGQKDRHRNLFNVWSAIFQVNRQKPQAISGDATISPLETRMKTVIQTIHQGGDNGQLMQGVFENYLHQKVSDPNMEGVAEATDWFCFNDRVQTFINHQQNYSVYPYLSYAFVVWHFLFASLAWPKITFPTKGFEVCIYHFLFVTIANVCKTWCKLCLNLRWLNFQIFLRIHYGEWVY
jgi:chromosome transmission fidelity protein 18